MLVLGSSSTARRELLKSVDIIPQKIAAPDVDERSLPNELPQDYVKRLAVTKANAITSEKEWYLITADTIVTVGRRILMKTSDESRAKEYLRLLSGRRHSVFTAFCVKHNDFVSLNLVRTVLKMRLLNENEISTYIATREWVGCAGAYSIQGRAKCFFPFISGCHSNVVGLPLPNLINALKGIGYFKKKYK